MTTSEPTGPVPTADASVAGQDVPAIQTAAQPTAVEAPNTATPDEGATAPVMEPQAAAELAQELALVTRALFAQLIPSTSQRAVAGAHGFDVAPAESSEATAHEPAAVSTAEEAAPPAQPVAVAPAAPAVPTAVTAPVAPAAVPVPGLAVPLPTAASVPTVAPPAAPAVVPTAQPPAQPPLAAVPATPSPVAVPVPSVPVPTRAPAKGGPRSTAMLDEIGFLDD